MEEKDPDVELIKNVAARLGERFGDYLILVRTPDSCLWKHSDQSWALGATMRYQGIMMDPSPVVEDQE